MNQRYVETIIRALRDPQGPVTGPERCEFILTALIAELRNDPGAVEAIRITGSHAPRIQRDELAKYLEQGS